MRAREPHVDLLLCATAESSKALADAQMALESAAANGALSRAELSSELRGECEALASLMAIAKSTTRASSLRVEDELLHVRGLQLRLGRQRARFDGAADCDVSA
jgi:hypothetical protein